MLSPASATHDQIVKLDACESAHIPEVWIVHPIDRVLAIYRLEDGHYGRARILELKGRTPIAAVQGLEIDWERVMAQVELD